MNSEKREFISLETPPVRQGIIETAWFFEPEAGGCPSGFSRPLTTNVEVQCSANPRNFATVDLQILRSDTRWLAKVPDAIVNHWRTKNSGGRDKKKNISAIG